MAPTIPKKRPSIRGKFTTSSTSKSGSGLMARPSVTGATIGDSFINSKKDKRTIKHSAFMNRIEKAHKKPLKRRRPNKKLVTNLESLGDVLGEMEVDGDLEFDGKSLEGEGKIRQKTLKVGPGAMKRKVKAERIERERFGKNMAQLLGGLQTQGSMEDGEKMAVEGQEGKPSETQTSATSSRWAALRGFISQTMEQKEEFKTT